MNLIYKHRGCKLCGKKNKKTKPRLTTEEFISRSIELHGNTYDYSKTKYIDSKHRVVITCKKHGDFEQMPYVHLVGCGCPRCNDSLLEREVAKLLDDNGISYERNKWFDWLVRKTLDFYIPSKKIAIECQGVQHFEPIRHFGGEEKFTKRVEYDNLKKQLCEEHGVKLLYFSNLGIEYPYEVIEDKEELLSRIMNDN